MGALDLKGAIVSISTLNLKTRSAYERGGNNLKGFNDFRLQNEHARTGFRACRCDCVPNRSTADPKFQTRTPVQATEPKGAVDLKGAIVSISKRVKLAIEIETGVLIAEKGLEKRVYVFTTVDPGTSISSLFRTGPGRDDR